MTEMDDDISEIATMYEAHMRMSPRDAVLAALETWRLLVVPTPADLARREARLRMVELQ